MNVYNMTRRWTYVTLTFTWSGGVTAITFDNMEVRGELGMLVANSPEIYTTPAGYAHAIPRRHPRGFRFEVTLHQAVTLCKLQTLVEITRDSYLLEVSIGGYWDCVRTVVRDPGGGASIGGPWILVGSTPPDLTSRFPSVGEAVLINGMGPVYFMPAQMEAYRRHEHAEVPWKIQAIVRYDQASIYHAIARGLGVRRDVTMPLEILESVRLSLPPLDGVIAADVGDLAAGGIVSPGG